MLLNMFYGKVQGQDLYHAGSHVEVYWRILFAISYHQLKGGKIVVGRKDVIMVSRLVRDHCFGA